MYIGKWKITKKDFIWLIICLLLIICFFIGIFVSKNSDECDVLSGASTAVSIILSIVAIIYTMIEGSNSSKINQDSISKLSNIDNQLKNVSEKLVELKSMDKKIRNIIPKIDSLVKEIENNDEENGNDIDEDIKEDLDSLLNYIKEDFDQ